MDYVKIGGKSWDVLVVGISETFNILYSNNTGRTMSRGAGMTLDPLGTFISHKVTVKRKNGYEQQFDELWDFLSVPRYNGIDVELVHNQTTIKYKAYVSTGTRDLRLVDISSGLVKWKQLEINIVPMEAQVLPV